MYCVCARYAVKSSSLEDLKMPILCMQRVLETCGNVFRYVQWQNSKCVQKARGKERLSHAQMKQRLAVWGFFGLILLF